MINFHYIKELGEYPVYHLTTDSSENIIHLLENADTPVLLSDSKSNSVYSILINRINGFFEGERSLEETADDIYQGIYLLQSEKN